jgi:hypothetical protein
MKPLTRLKITLTPRPVMLWAYRRRVKRFHPDWVLERGAIVEHWGRLTYLRVGEERSVPMSRLRGQPDHPAPQVVEAYLAGEETFARLCSQKVGEKAWTELYCEFRRDSLAKLVASSPADFVLTVAVDRNGYLEILDGNHRYEFMRRAGLSIARVNLTFPHEYRRWNTHRRIIDGLPFR